MGISSSSPADSPDVTVLYVAGFLGSNLFCKTSLLVYPDGELALSRMPPALGQNPGGISQENWLQCVNALEDTAKKAQSRRRGTLTTCLGAPLTTLTPKTWLLVVVDLRCRKLIVICLRSIEVY
jgi:hypothetical protein